MMHQLSAHELLTELRFLRQHLEPVLNVKMKNVLTEAERRLAGDPSPTVPHNMMLRKPQQGNRMTKEQTLNKWLNKY